MEIKDSKENIVGRVAGKAVLLEKIESVYLTGQDFSAVVRCNGEIITVTAVEGKISYESESAKPTGNEAGNNATAGGSGAGGENGNNNAADPTKGGAGEAGANNNTTPEPTKSFIKGKDQAGS